jgi:hypothetical protein
MKWPCEPHSTVCVCQSPSVLSSFDWFWDVSDTQGDPEDPSGLSIFMTLGFLSGDTFLVPLIWSFQTC